MKRSCEAMMTGHFLTFEFNPGLLSDCYLLFNSCYVSALVAIIALLSWTSTRRVFVDPNVLCGLCRVGILAEVNKLLQPSNHHPVLVLKTVVCLTAQLSQCVSQPLCCDMLFCENISFTLVNYPNTESIWPVKSVFVFSVRTLYQNKLHLNVHFFF